jgi:DNA-binding response OmpR family regulator
MTQRVRVLVVDDEPTLCRALTIVLEREGYDVTALESGERAHTLLREQHFDCMVVDLRMPDLRGDVLFELAASIQPHLRRRTIFTTGDTSERAQELVGACGCAMITKPFDLTELKRLVREITREVQGASA